MCEEDREGEAVRVDAFQQADQLLLPSRHLEPEHSYLGLISKSPNPKPSIPKLRKPTPQHQSTVTADDLAHF